MSVARIAPVIVITASALVVMALSVCVVSKMRRLGKRSATSPVCMPNISMGRNWNAMVTPTAAELRVRVSTSQSWAMLCIHVPVLARSWPVRYIR